MSEALQSLIERVEKATGESGRELHKLNGEIAAFFFPDAWRIVDGEVELNVSMGDEEPEWRRPDPYAEDAFPDNCTHSLDAALSLVSRVLPGWFPSIGQNIHYGHWRGSVRMVEETNGDIISFDGEHRTTPALAIILALLRAVSTVQAKNEVTEDTRR